MGAGEPMKVLSSPQLHLCLCLGLWDERGAEAVSDLSPGGGAQRSWPSASGEKSYCQHPQVYIFPPPFCFINFCCIVFCCVVTVSCLNPPILLQCPFSGWAGWCPAEDRGHFTDGEKTARCFCFFYFIWKILNNNISLFLTVFVSLCVSRRTVQRQSVLSLSQRWSWLSRSLCWTTSSSGAFLMSQSSYTAVIHTRQNKTKSPSWLLFETALLSSAVP